MALEVELALSTARLLRSLVAKSHAQLSDESVLRFVANPATYSLRVEVVEHPEPEGPRTVHTGAYL